MAQDERRRDGDAGYLSTRATLQDKTCNPPPFYSGQNKTEIIHLRRTKNDGKLTSFPLLTRFFSSREKNMYGKMKMCVGLTRGPCSVTTHNPVVISLWSFGPVKRARMGFHDQHKESNNGITLHLLIRQSGNFPRKRAQDSSRRFACLLPLPQGSLFLI